VFHKNSIYQISFDQKFGKSDFAQMLHEQNCFEKFQWPFLKTNKASTQTAGYYSPTRKDKRKYKFFKKNRR